jgi:hypothetical protein
VCEDSRTARARSGLGFEVSCLGELYRLFGLAQAAVAEAEPHPRRISPICTSYLGSGPCKEALGARGFPPPARQVRPKPPAGAAALGNREHQFGLVGDAVVFAQRLNFPLLGIEPASSALNPARRVPDKSFAMLSRSSAVCFRPNITIP